MRDGLGARICGVVVDHNTGPGTGPAPGYYPRGPGNKGKDDKKPAPPDDDIPSSPPPAPADVIKPGIPTYDWAWKGDTKKKKAMLVRWIQEQLLQNKKEFQVKMTGVTLWEEVINVWMADIAIGLGETRKELRPEVAGPGTAQITIRPQYQGFTGGTVEVVLYHFPKSEAVVAECTVSRPRKSRTKQQMLDDFIQTVLATRQQFSKSLAISDENIDEEDHDHHHETMRVMM